MITIKAVIFDMDGVISDTQKYHAQAESNLLKSYNIQLSPEEITKRFAGVSDDEMFRQIFSEANMSLPNVNKLVAKKWEAMFNLPGKVPAVAGSVRLIKELNKRGYKISIASSSPHKFIEKVIKDLGLVGQFGAIVSADDVDNGKPAPDIFILASAKLHVRTSECVVIEDGESGLIGAKKADMATIAYNLDSNYADHKAQNIIDVLQILEMS